MFKCTRLYEKTKQARNPCGTIIRQNNDLLLKRYRKSRVITQATKLYAVNQTSFDELLAAIKAETQVREVLDRVLGEVALQKLDTAFKAIHSESTTGV